MAPVCCGTRTPVGFVPAAEDHIAGALAATILADLAAGDGDDGDPWRKIVIYSEFSH